MGSRVETNQTTSARAIADIENGELLARVDIPAPPESIFPALASESITRWWVRPGVFDTREWTGDVRPGGAWRAAGIGGRGPYVLEGHFVEIDAPERLVHTWQAAGEAALTTVTYALERRGSGTRITLKHGGFTSGATCLATCEGWETSFARLEQLARSRAL